MHMAGKPTPQEPLGLFSFSELQTLDGSQTIDICQQFWQLCHIANDKIRATLLQKLTRLWRPCTRQYSHGQCSRGTSTQNIARRISNHDKRLALHSRGWLRVACRHLELEGMGLAQKRLIAMAA